METCIVTHRYPCGPHGKGLCNVTCMPEPCPPPLCLFKVDDSDKPSSREPLHEVRVATVGVPGVSISAALPNTYAADMLLLIVIPWFALVVSWFRCMYFLQSRRYWYPRMGGWAGSYPGAREDGRTKRIRGEIQAPRPVDGARVAGRAKYKRS